MDSNEDRQTTEVRETNTREGNENVRRQEVTQKQGADTRVVVQRVVWYIAGFIIVLLALRVLLLVLGANQENGFVDFVYALSGFFAMPFYGIFNYQPSYGQSTFEISSVVAILIYALVAWGVTKLFTLTSRS